MKKLLSVFLLSMIMFCSFSYAAIDEDAKHLPFHVHHVHAYAPGDFYGSCGNCGTGRLRVVDVIANPTCTSAGNIFVMCDSCGTVRSIAPPALGHDFSIIKSQTEATCTEDGKIVYGCSRCGASTTSYLPALGHDYYSRITLEPTCTEEGVRTYTCSRCEASYTRSIEALGHDYTYEEKEATCTQDGYKKGICSRCGDVTEEIFKAFGHDLESFKTVKEVTCTEDGQKEALCKTCGELVKEKIPAKGHKFPEEWLLVEEPGFFKEGLEKKVCEVCKEEIFQTIPKKDPLPLIIGGGAAALLGGLYLYWRRLRRLKKAVEETERFKPDFGSRSILIASSYDELIEKLKSRHYLQVVTCESGELVEKVEEEGPDLIILDVFNKNRYDELTALLEEELKEQKVGIVVRKTLLRTHKKRLDTLVRDKKLVNYVLYDSDTDEALVKLVLPILRPDIKSDESLGNIGAVADAMGIPYVSAIINAYVSSRDIKAIIEEGDIGVSGTAAIIGDIASILGMDGVASVAGLVDDLDQIKAAMDKESGAYEHKGGVEAAKDITEVVSDILNK